MRWITISTLAALTAMATAAAACADDDAQPFRAVATIFENRCLTCHNSKDRKGGLSLQTQKEALAGGENGESIYPGDVGSSFLLDYVSGEDPEMPKEDEPLSPADVKTLREWIAAGARWPEGVTLAAKDNWWSRQPLARAAVPEVPAKYAPRVRTPIDAFIIAKHQEHALELSPEADRRTLIRRLYFDLIGLPPTPEEAEAFVNDPDPQAFEKLVDRLLESPHYGERWARHWLDVVHYGDTHGFDKDKVRPNAWPYRDYVIRAFNEDKPYERFVKEQLAGDVFYPGTRDGIAALGFIAAGPFDWVGHIEVRNGTMEKQRVRNLDRDDMVSSTMNTFVSMTAQCARCHDHKFDPVRQEDYYRLQAVFAAVDRADRPFDGDPQSAQRRVALERQLKDLKEQRQAIDAKIQQLAGPKLAEIDKRLAELTRQQGGERPEFGYHSNIEPRHAAAKWVQVDLGQPTPMAHIVYVGCHDTFAGIGAGFGFPVRYKIEISDDAEFKSGVTVVADHTGADVSNPGVVPQSVTVERKSARYVRVTATKLAPRQNDYIFALAELAVLTPEGDNAALGKMVTSLDSIEAPVRWGRKNLVDGYYYGVGQKDSAPQIARLTAEREAIVAAAIDVATKQDMARLDQAIERAESELSALPARGMVYAVATQFSGSGKFVPTGGEPRPIYLLQRGNEQSPDTELGPLPPGAVAALEHLNHHFDLPPDHSEAHRRAALAEWIVDKQNPLTWRSIVNRVWHYHFGRGIVDSPNDFGRMGARPTHPELLDWLAVEFRDGGQSFKSLHRLICNSAAYRQSSASHEAFAKIDGGNRFLWRANRSKLEAEAVRDAVLAVAGKLDARMGGPGFRAFGFKDDHSPHYKYHEHDVDDPASHRRSIYRFIVRSVPDPFMTTLDCADPSLNVAKRNETLTALQALALLNNKFMVRMGEHFAARADQLGDTPEEKVEAVFRLALARAPSEQERATLAAIAEEHGLANACRLIFNLNEFVFVD